MSRRYGRNQKRRAAKHIEHLNEALLFAQQAGVRDAGLAKYYRRRELEHRAALSEIVRAITAICPDSALLPANVKIGGVEVFDGTLRVEIRPRPLYSPVGEVADYCSIRTLTLSRVIGAMEQSHTKLETAVHLHLQGQKPCDMAYYISDSAIFHLGIPLSERRRLVEGLVNELMERFNDTIRSDGR